jgi:DNA end-binding protein Ku
MPATETATPARTVAQRAVWTGTISFGLVSVPVKLYSATESRRAAFGQYCREHQQPVKMPKVCAQGHEVTVGDVVKGIETARGLVLLEASELAELRLESDKVIHLLQFVPVVDAATRFRAKGHYLVGAGAGGAKALALLRAALRKTGSAAIGKVSLKVGTGEHLAVLSADAEGNVNLTTVHFPDEVRDGGGLRLATDVPVSDAELNLAIQLVQGNRAPIAAELVRDEYRDAVDALIASKDPVPGTEVAGVPASSAVDLVAALKASVEATKGAAATKRRSGKVS